MDVPISTHPTVADYRSPPLTKVLDRPALLLSDRVLILADRHRHKLLIALVFIYLLGFNAHWRVEPDSALYLTIGRNLAQGHGYTYHGARHHLAFPGLPLLFSAVFKLFGTRTLVPALSIMLLIGAATLALTYRLFLLYAGRPTAVLLTFGLGISRLFYRYCFELLSDMPFLLGVMAFLVGFEAIFYQRHREPGDRSPTQARWFDWVLLVSGWLIAVAMRPSMWALLAAVVLALAWSAIRSPARRPWALVFIAAVLAAGATFWMLDPRRGGNASMGEYEDALFNASAAHFWTLLHELPPHIGKLFNATLSQALFGARLGPGLSEVAGAAVIVVCLTMLWDRPLWFLWVAMSFLMIVVAIEPLDRYFLEVLPLMIFAWWRGIRRLNAKLVTYSPKWADWIFAGLFVLGGLTNLMRIGEFVVEQRRPHFLNAYKEGRYASADQVARLLHDRVDPQGWVITTAKFARTLTFLSQRNIVGPGSEMRSPGTRVVYVLEPLDQPVRDKLNTLGLKVGAQIGPEIQSKTDPEPWRLRRAEPQ